MLSSFIRRIPFIEKLGQGYREGSAFKINSFYPAGHFYSRIASLGKIEIKDGKVFGEVSLSYKNTGGNLWLTKR